MFYMRTEDECVGCAGGKRVGRPHFVVNEGNMIWILLL